MREGTVDLETGVVGARTGPEVRAQALFEDRLVGVVRADHPLARGEVTAAGFVAGDHVAVSRRDLEGASIDRALASLGLTRVVGVTVDGFARALALARATERIATVPDAHTAGLRHGLHAFPLPFPVPWFKVSLLWHPRMDGDPAHRWLRGCVREACGADRVAG